MYGVGGDDDASIVGLIQTKYVPFLKKLISFLEKKTTGKESVNKLKSIFEVFTHSSIREQVEVYHANKKKLEKWYKTTQKDKMTDKEGRSAANETAATGESSQNAPSSNSVQSTVQLGAPPVNRVVNAPAVVKTPAVVNAPALIAPPQMTAVQFNNETASNTAEGMSYPCASCTFVTTDEQEFTKHARNDHRSELSMWCKFCGRCFSNSGVLLAHLKERSCVQEDIMVYTCGVKECGFETTVGQTFVHHLRHCHKGSPFIFCVHCQKIFTLPHCLILHMQDECVHKDRNRRPLPAGSTPQRAALPSPNSFVPSNKPVELTPAQQQSLQLARAPAAVVPSPSVPTAASTGNTMPTRGSSMPTRGSSMPTRGSILPTRGRGRGRGRGRFRPPSDESSDSEDYDDPVWKPEEVAQNSNLRRSGRYAKKVSDVINAEPEDIVKKKRTTLTHADMLSQKMSKCPVCDYTATFQSVLNDHYIASHKKAEKNGCKICHVKFETTELFLQHFDNHPPPPASNVIEVDLETTSPVTFAAENTDGYVRKPPELRPKSIPQGLTMVAPLQVLTNKVGAEPKIKRPEDMKPAADIKAMMVAEKVKDFYKCMFSGCLYTASSYVAFKAHLQLAHSKERENFCVYCLKSFPQTSLLVDHMLSAHGLRTVQCSVCFYRAHSKGHVQMHIARYHPDAEAEPLLCGENIAPANVTIQPVPETVPCNPYVCAAGNCDFSTNELSGFIGHLESAHRGMSSWRCHYCSTDFVSLGRLVSHYTLHGINVYQCNYCAHGTETKEEVMHHLSLMHPDWPLQAFMRGTENDVASQGIVVQGENAPKDADDATTDDVSLSNGDEFVVDFEAAVYDKFPSKSGDKHTYYYPKCLKNVCSDLICGVPFCIERFGTITSYLSHLRTSHSAMNLLCPHCPHVSEMWNSFLEHLCCHSSSLFACGVSDCNFYSFDRADFESHDQQMHKGIAGEPVAVRTADDEEDENVIDRIKSLSNSSPFTVSGSTLNCFFCEYKTGCKRTMRNHLYRELRYKRFCCKLCCERFPTRKEIREHFKEDHPNLPEIVCVPELNPEIESTVQKLLENPNTSTRVAVASCKYCGRRFQSFVQYQMHICLCATSHYQPYMCLHCKESFNDLLLLKYHTDSQHPDKTISMSESSSFEVESRIESKLQAVRLRQLIDALGEVKVPPKAFVKNYACDSCGYSSNDKQNIQKHITDQHDSKTRINKSFKSVEGSEITDSEIESEHYGCSFCIRRYASLQQLRRHMLQVHSDKDLDRYPYFYSPDSAIKNFENCTEKFQCAYCKSGSGQLQELKTHSEHMHCGSLFKVKGVLTRISRDSTVACGYCYFSGEDMPLHFSEVHSGQPNKYFSGFRKDQLSEDDSTSKRVRFKTEVWVCEHCKYAFANAESFNTHCKKSHSRLQAKVKKISQVRVKDMRFYKCEFCSYTSERDYLGGHMSSKHSNSVICGWCSRRFEFATRLREHHDIVHKDKEVRLSKPLANNKNNVQKNETNDEKPKKRKAEDGGKDSQKQQKKEPQIKNQKFSKELLKLTVLTEQNEKMQFSEYVEKNFIFPMVSVQDCQKQS